MELGVEATFDSQLLCKKLNYDAHSNGIIKFISDEILATKGFWMMPKQLQRTEYSKRTRNEMRRRSMKSNFSQTISPINIC